MEPYTVSRVLLERRVEDYRANSSLMPGKGGLMTKAFAQSLGLSAGKTIGTYDLMYSAIEAGESVEEVQKRVKRDVGQKSKVPFKVPLMKEKNARNCGLVSLNYSGFYDNEVALYSALKEDLADFTGSIDDVLQETTRLATANPEKYRSLLEQKRQSIDDFAILMGLEKNPERRKELGTEMPEHMDKYFNMVSRVHNGANFGLSWPISIKKFSEPMREGLYNDSLAAAIQEGLGEDLGFTAPNPSTYKLMLEQVKETVREVKSTKNPLARKWKAATALPTSLFFLSGMNAYAASLTVQTDGSLLPEEVTTAVSQASTCATTVDSSCQTGTITTLDVEEGLDGFFTTFLSGLTTTLA